jgi:protein Tex
MAKDLNCAVADLLKSAELRDRIDLNRYVTDKIGIPTLQDIRDELARPGRDPREAFAAFSFAEGVTEMADLEPGMRLPGIVTNVTAFGAFVDVGVHQDGLVHISELADRFVKDPAEIVKVQQTVQVTVLGVDPTESASPCPCEATPTRPGPNPENRPRAKNPRPPASVPRKTRKKTARPGGRRTRRFTIPWPKPCASAEGGNDGGGGSGTEAGRASPAPASPFPRHSDGFPVPSRVFLPWITLGAPLIPKGFAAYTRAGTQG